MAKQKNEEGTFVVLQTNTNHEDAVFGPFSDRDEAQMAKFNLGAQDQLHEFKVLEVQEVSEEEE